jgi:hypothetical protein
MRAASRAKARGFVSRTRGPCARRRPPCLRGAPLRRAMTETRMEEGWTSRPARPRSSRCGPVGPSLGSPRPSDARVVGLGAFRALEDRVRGQVQHGDRVCAVAPVHGARRGTADRARRPRCRRRCSPRARSGERSSVGVANTLARHHPHAQAAGHAHERADDPSSSRSDSAIVLEVRSANARALERKRKASPSQARRCRRAPGPVIGRHESSLAS